jgi:hypothetical protein
VDFLGNISLRLVGMVATIVTLGAAYLFIVKPVLDTTNNAFNQVGKFNEPISRSLDITERQLHQSVRQARRQDRGAIRINGQGQVGLRRAQRLLGCVQRANGDVNRMSACAQRLGP